MRYTSTLTFTFTCSLIAIRILVSYRSRVEILWVINFTFSQNFILLRYLQLEGLAYSNSYLQLEGLAYSNSLGCLDAAIGAYDRHKLDDLFSTSVSSLSGLTN